MFTVNAANATLPATITTDQIAALIQNPVLSAWCSTVKRTTNGPLTIAGSYNIASVTRTGTGLYDIVFTQPMSNADYAVTSMSGGSDVTVTNAVGSCYMSSGKTANGFTLGIRDLSGNFVDQGFDIHVASEARNGTLGGGADAWGNVSSNGTVNGSYNSTVTRTATGKYTVTFTNPMPNANYSVTTACGVLSNNSVVTTENFTVNGFDVATGAGSSAADRDFNYAVFATDGNAGGFLVRTGDGANEVLSTLNTQATFQAAALTDGTTTKTMTEVLGGAQRIAQLEAEVASLKSNDGLDDSERTALLALISSLANRVTQLENS